MIELDLWLPLASFDLKVKLRSEAGALGILGRSGAGKSSLIEMLAGVRKGGRGRVTVGGRTLMDSDRGLRLSPEARRVGWVPQDVLLFPHLTVRQNVLFGAPRGGPARDELGELLALLGLEPLLSRYPASLSGGERQRVALARALASFPELLLWDEPLAALDVGLKDRVLPHLLRLRQRLTVPLVFVTHQWSEARLLADQVLVLERGRAQAFGPAAEVIDALTAQLREGDNLLCGTLTADEQGERRLLRVGALLLSIPPSDRPAGTSALYSLSPDEVLIARAAPSGLSARNVLRARIEALQTEGGRAIIRLSSGDLPWVVHLTSSDARELELSAGLEVQLVIKAHSLREVG